MPFSNPSCLFHLDMAVRIELSSFSSLTKQILFSCNMKELNQNIGACTLTAFAFQSLMLVFMALCLDDSSLTDADFAGQLSLRAYFLMYSSDMPLNIASHAIFFCIDFLTAASVTSLITSFNFLANFSFSYLIMCVNSLANSLLVLCA